MKAVNSHQDGGSPIQLERRLTKLNMVAMTFAILKYVSQLSNSCLRAHIAFTALGSLWQAPWELFYPLEVQSLFSTVSYSAFYATSVSQPVSES
jgi:hypothetical protein